MKSVYYITAYKKMASLYGIGGPACVLPKRYFDHDSTMQQARIWVGKNLSFLARFTLYIHHEYSFTGSMRAAV